MTSIHVVALGVYGEYARHHTQKLFETLPYVLCATLDLQPPREYGYSALNLRVVLQSLVPKPQAFIIGLQIDDAMAKEAQGVWNEYMQSSGQSNTIAWKLRESDWQTEVLQTLDEKFGRREGGDLKG